MPKSSNTETAVQKHFSTSILLWVRNDQPRQTGMDYWKGPHSGIISATPGFAEYRQVHLAEHNPGRWPASAELQTSIPEDRRVDGIAEVTFESALAPLLGRQQTALAYKDEINVFRRTLLYAGPPNTTRWYGVNEAGAPIGSRALLFLRRREGVGAGEFRRVVKRGFVSALIGLGVLRELRTQVFMPWTEKTWDTPNVAHDNPHDEHLHASAMLGFEDDAARDSFFAKERDSGHLSALLAPVASAVRAYDVSAALTFVRDGEILAEPEA